MTDEVHPTAAFCLDAVDRIARTPDGAALYVFLQRRLMAVPVTFEPGALQWDHGERSFASRLIGLMAKGIYESGGRTGTTGSSAGPSGSEQPLVVPSPRAVRARGEPGSRRRITADTVIPGWNDRPAGDD